MQSFFSYIRVNCIDKNHARNIPNTIGKLLKYGHAGKLDSLESARFIINSVSSYSQNIRSCKKFVWKLYNLALKKIYRCYQKGG